MTFTAVRTRVSKHRVPLAILAALVIAAAIFHGQLVAWFSLKPMGGSQSAASRAQAGALALDVSIAPDPPQQKGNALLVKIADSDGAPVTGAKLDVDYDMPAMGAMPEMRGKADITEEGKGRYKAAFDLPMGGTWTLIVAVAPPAGDPVKARYTITVGSPGLVALGSSAAAAAPAGAKPVDVPAAAVPRLRQAVAGYEAARAQLAKDVFAGAAAAGKTIASSLRAARPDLPADDAFLRCVDGAAAAADAMAASSSLPSARASFAGLSEELACVVAAAPQLAPDWHVFECPMKKDGYNKWLQPEATADNPYMGTKMPTCGIERSVEEAVARAQTGAGEHGGGDDVITVDEVRRQQIGVRTGTVKRGPLHLSIRAIGRVAYDETRLQDVTLKYGGYVEKLSVNATGQPVKRGQVLFTIYSPELYAAEQEYLLALNSRKDAGARADYLVEGAREKLALWDVTRKQLDDLAARGVAPRVLPVLAPSSGFVIEKNIVQGAAVKAGQRLFRIAGLDRVWVEADVYEPDLPHVSVGQPATVALSVVPGHVYQGKVAYVYPYLDGKARTGKVRIELANPKLELKPEMYADVTLHADLGDRLLVPDSAILYTGPRRIVFLDLGEGRLRPKEIRAGAKAGDQVEVLAGLHEGDRVVTSANFLIASESRLRSALEFWQGGGTGDGAQ